MQEIEIPEALWQQMATIGPRWSTNVSGHVKQMIDAFTPLLARAPKDGVTRTDDVAYGLHPRHVLDIYQPNGARNVPLVLFFHGGAFVDGEKNRGPEVYGNVCYAFARHGIAAMNVEYRLAPEFKYPSAAHDVAAAVAWACENAVRLGVDARRIFLMAHSAGAAHTGAYLHVPGQQPSGGHGIAGHIVVSGRVRADNSPENPNAKKVEAYYGTDASQFDALSPVSHVNAQSVPTFVAYAEYENPLIDVYCTELAYRWAQAKRRAPPILYVARHNHTSIIAHFNTAEDRLASEIRAFVAATSPLL
jgi:acetyl esterase